jgi:hypothetical protein
MGPTRSRPTRRQALLLAACAWVPPSTLAQTPRPVPAELRGEWPGAHLQGSGRMRFLGFQVYDIRLWTAEPRFAEDDWARTPLALEIEYARGFDAKLIAESSIDEMRRSGPIAADAENRWLAAMKGVFPDVKAGDRLTGVQRPGTESRFFHNGALRGEVRDGEFTRRFFGIWLAPSTSEPRLRESLLGTP